MSLSRKKTDLIRGGVGRQLRLAFLLVSGLSLIAAIVAFWGFQTIENAQRVIVDDALPSMLGTQRVSEESDALVEASEDLASVATIADLERIQVEFNAKSKSLIADIAFLSQRRNFENLQEELGASVKEIQSNFDGLGAIIKKRITESAERDQLVASGIEAANKIEQLLGTAIIEFSADHSREVVEFEKEVETFRSNEELDDFQRRWRRLIESGPIEMERLLEARFRAQRLIDILDRLGIEVLAGRLEIHRDVFDLNLRSIARLARSVSDEDQRLQMAQSLRVLFSISNAQQDVFAKSVALLDVNAKIDVLQLTNKKIAQNINGVADVLVETSNVNIRQTSISAKSAIETSRALLVFIVIFVFVATIFIVWFYVSGRIVKRLGVLADNTYSLAEGRLDIDIELPGNDELSHMGDALKVFQGNALKLREQDKTLRQKSEELSNTNNELLVAEERFRLAAEGGSVGIWDWEDVDGEAQIWSAKYYELLGYTPDEIVASQATFLDLLHPDDVHLINDAIGAHLKSNEAYELEYRLRKKSGEYQWYLGAGQMTRNSKGKPNRMVGTLMDIHDRKTAEGALEQQASDLRRSNKELEQFAYVASHDLQEPLRMVSSYVDLLRRRYRDKLDSDAMEFIDFAVEGAGRMKNLLNDLLQYSRVGRVELMLRPTDLNVVLEDVSRDLESFVKECNGTISHSELPMVMADAGMLRRLIQNLVQNGLKFSKDEHPTVSISAEIEGDWVTVSIEDNGIGIDTKFSERIFEVFQRLHTRVDFSGNGIGLAISQRIAERHGGKIWFEANEGAGTTFKFTLRAAVQGS